MMLGPIASHLFHQAHVAAKGYEGADVIYRDVPLGTIRLEICDECFHVTTYCEHTKNSWNRRGTKLTCDLCGEDGT